MRPRLAVKAKCGYAARSRRRVPPPQEDSEVENLFPELDRVANAANLLGYLNFSDGRPDARWQKQLNDAYAYLADQGVVAPWQVLYEWLRTRLAALQETGAKGFKEVGQARAVLKLAFVRVLAAYRAHHVDLLFHLNDRELFQPFFLARVCEAVLAERGDVPTEGRMVGGVLARLNDFVGYRPIAILETRPRGEPYDHERVRPIPLFLRGAGVSHGRYAAVLSGAIEILSQTDAALLAEAHFDLNLLDELAVDPRAYDHAHPANKRPNYVFGEWDPHHIDNQGRYRRYVARQITLDALLNRVEQPGSVDAGEALFEAAAVLAGTLLMATGVSGSGPSAHDSTTTLSTLTPRIAQYRDAFYADLMRKVPGAHGERLRKEAEATRQPFGAARQHFNRYLARHRALQLQQRHLAVLYAEMGYAEAGREEAARIPTPSIRLMSEIQGRLSTGRLLRDRGELAQAAPLLAEIADLLQRGIACGAFVDPWNILGFQALFPLFPSREDAVRDHRVDELVSLVEQSFDLHARLMSEAAAIGDKAVTESLATSLRKLASWWDPFGTVHVADVAQVHGGEAQTSAEQVAMALARWHERGQATADLGFWRNHVEGFRSAKAFSLVVDALLRKRDYRAAMALLVNWLGQADKVPLEEGEHSFAALALRWMLALTAQGRGARAQAPEASDAWLLIRKFFDYVEANAEEYSQVPSLGQRETEAADEGEENGGLYGAAYEDVTYRDSSEDGTEGAVADEGLPEQSFDLEEESEHLEERLRFLSTMARLWQIAARYGPGIDPDREWAGVIVGWRDAARAQQQKLAELLDALHAVAVPEPVSAGDEALVEYDRRRVLKEQLVYTAINASLDTTLAVGALQGALQAARPAEAGPATKAADPVAATTWGPLAIRLETALFQGDADAARSVLPKFLDLFKTEPLLFQALAEGGEPRQILRVRIAQTMLRALAGNLPRLGLLRETYHVLRGAWASEQANPPSGRGITEFNHLFQAAYQSVVECAVESSAAWTSAAEGEGDRDLVNLLETLTAPFLTLWIEHSRSLQLSCLEAVRGDRQWEAMREFIKRYGRDLFQTRFLTVANLRGILHHGVGAYLDSLAENPDPLHPIRLMEDLGRRVTREEAIANLQEILQAVVENYEEYKDYNTTTSLSDYGDNLHVLLDFLRLKANYERHAWQFRPLALAHEVLARAGRAEAAVLWEGAFTQMTRELADQHLTQLHKLEQQHGIHLNTVADRLRERFVKRLNLDRLCALIEPAVTEAGQPGEHPAFTRLREAIQPLAADPLGVGLEAPPWLRRLESETQRVQTSRSAVVVLAEELFRVPKRLISQEELQRQMSEWEKPL
jgi:hypothetical protein